MSILKYAVLLSITLMINGCKDSETTNNTTQVEQVGNNDAYDIGVDSAIFTEFSIDEPSVPVGSIYRLGWPDGYNPTISGTIHLKNFGSRRYNGQVTINLLSLNVWGSIPITHYVDLQPGAGTDLSFSTAIYLGGSAMDVVFINQPHYVALHISGDVQRIEDGRYDYDLDNNIYSESYVLVPAGPG